MFSRGRRQARGGPLVVDGLGGAEELDPAAEEQAPRREQRVVDLPARETAGPTRSEHPPRASGLDPSHLFISVHNTQSKPQNLLFFVHKYLTADKSPAR